VLFNLSVSRALEVFKDHGKRLSEIIADQRRLPGKKQNLVSALCTFFQSSIITLSNERIDNDAHEKDVTNSFLFLRRPSSWHLKHHYRQKALQI
jgi:hypothetical protein